MKRDGESGLPAEPTQRALDRALLGNLPILSVALAWLYLIYALAHACLLEGSTRTFMIVVALGSAAGLAALHRWLVRSSPDPALANATGAVIAVVVLINSATHLYATGEDFQTTNFLLLLVGQGLLFMSGRWLVATAIVTWLAWGGALWAHPRSPTFAHWLIAMMVATALAGIAYSVRLRTLRLLEGLRHDLERRVEIRTAELSERTRALSQANQALATEVGSRREAEERVRAGAELLTLVIESLPACIAYLDREERHALANESYAECFGRSTGDLRGVSLREVMGDGLYAAVAPSLRQVLAGERPRLEVRRPGEPGASRDYDLRLTPHVLADGTVIGFFLLALEVTEQKRQEQAWIAAQRSESLGVLAGGIAHDFNNLLTTILGSVSLARQETACLPGAGVYLDSIRDSSQKAAELCHQLLAYAGRGAAALEVFDVNGVLRENTALLRMTVGRRAQLRLEPGEGSLEIEGDRNQFRQLLMNLVSNAAEAMEDRRGCIVVRTGNRSVTAAELESAAVGSGLPGGNYVFLSIADDGAGMSAETLDHIFEPFFSTRFTGRGLGLAAAAGIVRRQHGAIVVQSQPGAGTTFCAYMPPATRPDAPPPEPTPPAPRSARAGCALIVDDDSDVRWVAEKLLKSFGWRVVSAPSGPAAVAEIESHSGAFDVILLDLTMPEMDGRTTLREIRQRGVSTPVVLMSGYSAEESLRDFDPGEFSRFLQKPFTQDALGACLREVAPPGEGGQSGASAD